jgi:NADH-quinone oxidoreductase subunit L
MHDEQDLKKMGGLARFMPVTAGTFVVAWLAIAGVPPLAGFFAKGDVLDNAFAAYPVLWVIGIVTALLTAYYLSRLFVLAFTGNPRFLEAVNTRRSAGGQEDVASGGAGNGGGSAVGSAGAGNGAGSSAKQSISESPHESLHESPHESPHGSPHESPKVMLIPLVVLAVFAFVGGVLELPWHGPDSVRFLSWLKPVFATYLYHAHLSVASSWILAVVDTLVALSGIYIAWRLWSKAWDRPKLEPSFLFRSWFLNEIYDFFIGRPGDRLAGFTFSVVEIRGIDGVVNGVASLAKATGSGLRRIQTGFVRQYALGIALGLVALLAWMLVRA